LIFDLDGTLVDTVYAHVFAWQRAFAEQGLPIDGWRIHRRVGMSGGLFARAAAREIGHEFSDEEAEALQRRHGELYRELLPERRPLLGAVELLGELRAQGVSHGIATSGLPRRRRAAALARRARSSAVRFLTFLGRRCRWEPRAGRAWTVRRGTASRGRRLDRAGSVVSLSRSPALRGGSERRPGT
jgi:beta-phosphoglucomutase-like phosphatase (HAD superfamily)